MATSSTGVSPPIWQRPRIGDVVVAHPETRARWEAVERDRALRDLLRQDGVTPSVEGGASGSITHRPGVLVQGPARAARRRSRRTRALEPHAPGIPLADENLARRPVRRM